MMKKTCLLAALVVAFSVTMLAQESGSSGDQGTSSTTTTSKHTTHSKSSMGKETTLTGCLSGPNDEGAYVLATKSGHKVEVGGLDELKSHVGHEVKITGSYASGKDIGENESAEKGEKGEKGEKSEKGERHLKATAITHVSDTCTTGSAMGKKKTGKSTSETPSESPK